MKLLFADDVGLMRVSQMNGADLLPEDPDTTMCIEGCFKAGDIRANEQQGLTSFHTLFLREHNRIARTLKRLNAHWNGETVFQETRKIVGAIIQKIVYGDYLPIILGPDALPSYARHNPNINPSISNAFAAAAYRFGHSTIRSKFDLLDKNYEEVAPAMKLRFMFFNNTVTETIGVEPVLFGLVGNVSEKVDTVLSKEITEHLFERGNQHGENLAALNLQRSRDHGLPGYNEFRRYCGVSNARTFEDTRNEIRDANNRAILRNLYNDDPNFVELWMAGLAEVPFPGATVGPTLRCVIYESNSSGLGMVIVFSMKTRAFLVQAKYWKLRKPVCLVSIAIMSMVLCLFKEMRSNQQSMKVVLHVNKLLACHFANGKVRFLYSCRLL